MSRTGRGREQTNNIVVDCARRFGGNRSVECVNTEYRIRMVFVFNMLIDCNPPPQPCECTRLILLSNRTHKRRILKLTQECYVTGRVADEFNEWLLDELAQCRIGHQNVGEREEGEEEANADQLQCLYGNVLAPETRKTFVPNGCQQLLDIGMGTELSVRKLV